MVNRSAELLGTATFPSGDLLLIDFGLLRMWCGDREPALSEGLASPESVARAAESQDFEITGPDAAEVAARLDLAVVKGRYAFDLPDGAPIANRVAGFGLDAALRPIPRMPHHTRVQRLLDDDPGGAEVPYFGGWAVAVRGLPADRELPVRGVRMAEHYEDRWRSVWVECADGEPARSVHCGHVLVDEARLMFADPTALNGWRDDDHHRLLSRMRGAPTESGTVDVAGGLMTGFFTSWGDGAFPVYRDLAEDGTLLRVRVEVGADEIVTRQRRFERLWFGDLAQLAIVSNRVARDGEPACWLYREEPDNERDSGWRVFAGDESDEYVDGAENCSLMPLRELISADPSVEAVLTEPAPAAFERDSRDDDFVRAD